MDTYDLAFNLISGKGTEGLKVKYKKRQVLTVKRKESCGRPLKKASQRV